MKVFGLQEIKALLDIQAAEDAISRSFELFSVGASQIPKPGELFFPEHLGECHIKYGHLKGEPYFAVKIATGFYANHSLGLSSGDGMISLFSATTGKLLTIFIDEGYLTDIRTAIAGRIVARYMAPSRVNSIGVIGAGIQARMQVEQLQGVIDCKSIIAYARRPEALQEYCQYMSSVGYEVRAAESVAEVFEHADYIVTTTPSKEAFVKAEYLRQGQHITAVGSDGDGKQEICVDALAGAVRIIVDSLSQCERVGELSHLLKAGFNEPRAVEELGAIISNPSKLARQSASEITIADLTGVACQDIAIASSVYERWLASDTQSP
jgi:ornithine cyclodeaminase